MQNRILKQLHQAHPGIVRMKALARSWVYWPDIDGHIEALVRTCQRCASAAKAPIKSCLSSWPVPDKPWSRVHMDYAGPFQGQNYLIVIDALTKWPEIELMPSTTARATIKTLREMFARFGSPECIVSDNGPQFVSTEMRSFFEAEGILHIKTPPFHPQSNGQAERFVDTMKRALVKAEGEENVHTILQTFLKTYRTTPNTAIPNNASPAVMMFGRNIRTTLSMVKETPDQPKIRRQPSMEVQFNRQHGAIQHKEYYIADRVYVYDYTVPNKRSWVLATILEKVGSMIYIVRTDNNKVWKRHTNQMKRCHSDELKSTSAPDDSLPTPKLQSSSSFSTFTQSPARSPTTSSELETALVVPPGSSEPEVTPVIDTATDAANWRTQRRRIPPKRLLITHDARGRYEET